MNTVIVGNDCCRIWISLSLTTVLKIKSEKYWQCESTQLYLKSFVQTPISSDFLTFPPWLFLPVKNIVLLFSQRRSHSVFWRIWLQRKTRSLSPFRHNCYFCSDRWVHFFFFHFSFSLDDSDLYKQLCARNVIFAQGASFQKAFYQHCVLSSWSTSVIEIVMSPVILQLVMDCTRFVISVWLLSGSFASPNLLLWCSVVQAFLWDSQNNYFRISVIIDNLYLFRVLNLIDH